LAAWLLRFAAQVCTARQAFANGCERVGQRRA
jgi:hypothetical protein